MDKKIKKINQGDKGRKKIKNIEMKGTQLRPSLMSSLPLPVGLWTQ